MRIAVIACAAILAMLSLGGCASRNVAAVKDSEQRAPEVWDSLSHLVSQSSLNENDRLVILRISHKNPLQFRNEIDFRQYPKGKSGRTFLTIYPHHEQGEELVLIKFKPDAGDTAYVQVMPCNTSSNTWCVFTQSANESHLKIKLPPPSGVVYAGHMNYEIADEFPERGTQNIPHIEKLGVTDEYEQDLQAAVKKWPLLKERKVEKDIASVSEGRAKVFVAGSKEFNE